MKNPQKLKHTKFSKNNDEPPAGISLFNGIIQTVSGTFVLMVLFYINSPEFDIQRRLKRSLIYQEKLEDVASVHLISDEDFDFMQTRKRRDLDDFTDLVEGELDEENLDNSTAEFNEFLEQIGIQDVENFELPLTEVIEETGSGFDLGVFDYDYSADGSGFNDYSDEDSLIFARSFTDQQKTATDKRRQRLIEARRRRRNRKPREHKINWNRLRPQELEKIAPKMMTKFEERMSSFKELVKNVTLAEEDPEKRSEPGYDSFEGYDRTAPIVNKFINALNCKADGSGIFKQPGKTSVYVLFPGAVSLFSEPGKVVEDYSFYWKWWMKVASLLPTDRFNNVRFSVGVYSTSAAFTPKGFKPRANMPWERLQRFYKAPRMTAVQPNLLAAAARVNTWVYQYGASTPMVGDNCMFFWFIHNVPGDLEKFNIPEHYAHWEDLKSMCNVIPVIIGPKDKDPENAWGRLAALLEPGLQTYFPKDPDFSGVFRLEKHEDLISEGFLKTVFQYVCLLESRTLCRFKKKGFEFEKTQESESIMDEAFRVYDEGIDGGVDYPIYDEPVVVTEASKISKAPDLPEADVCCGHGMYSGTAYNNEERTCCANGSVKKYLETGLDACVVNEEDEFAF